MPNRSLIVLTFEALATSPLAPYGCSWLEGPGLNRLAASSLVFDRVVAASVSPEDVLAGYFRDTAGGQSVAAVAAAAGMATLLFTDSDEALELGAAALFDQCVRVEGLPESAGDEPLGPADQVEEMHLARLLAAALAQRETLGDAPALVWIHSASLARLWDAPHALRTADEHDYEEPQPEEDDGSERDELAPPDYEEEAELEIARQAIIPPDLQLESDADPDLLLAWMAAYGGQIRALDSLLEVLLDALEEGPEADFVLASTSGFALGEHGWIGAAAGPPYSPRIQLPLMIRQAGRQPLRSLHLAFSDRLAATLIEMLSDHPPADGHESLLQDVTPERWAAPPEPLAPILVTQTSEPPTSTTAEAASDSEPGPAAAAVLKTSPGWLYYREPNGDEHLYLKPDDRNDINDIANLKPEVVQTFQGLSPDAD